MGAGLIELISSIVDITGNPVFDTIIFAIIGSFSASIAFGFVGALFDFTGNHNSKDMSDVHWGVRVFVFALLTFVLVKIAQFFRWLFKPPQVYFLIAGLVLVILAIIIIVIINSKRNINKIETPSLIATKKQKEEGEPAKVSSQVVSYNVDICPYCGGKLVHRKGPYGRFLGCTNYPECKYTRNQD